MSSKKVYIKKITPGMHQDRLFTEHKKCYIGISLTNPMLSGEYLRLILDWATFNFEHTLIVVGDLLQRYNKTFIEGMDCERAKESAIEDGNIYLKRNLCILQLFDQQKLTIKRWTELMQTAEFSSYLIGLKDIYVQNKTFRNLIEKDANKFVDSQVSRGNAINDLLLAKEMSCEYLLEEIAVFGVLTDQGWTVDVYPGPELLALEKIASGTINDMPDIFRKRINIEICFE